MTREEVIEKLGSHYETLKTMAPTEEELDAVLSRVADLTPDMLEAFISHLADPRHKRVQELSEQADKVIPEDASTLATEVLAHLAPILELLAPTPNGEPLLVSSFELCLALPLPPHSHKFRVISLRPTKIVRDPTTFAKAVLQLLTVRPETYPYLRPEETT